MKKHSIYSRFFFTFFLILISCFRVFPKVQQIPDPLLNHSNYLAIDAGMNYVSPEYRYPYCIIQEVRFNLSNNLSGSYNPITSFEIGHVFKIGKEEPIVFRLNSGLSIASYSVNMIPDYNTFNYFPSAYRFVGSNYTLFNLSETFIQVPLAISTHIPLKIFQPQARYHALELKLGCYYGFNINREIQSQVIPESNSSTEYILPPHKFGKLTLFAESGVSFTSQNGNSHEIGCRATYDPGPYFTDAPGSEIPFLYNSIGIFYRWTFYSF